MLKRIASRARLRMRSEGGFSLLEVILAIGLLAVITAPLALVLEASYVAHKLSRDKTIAQQQAMDQVEKIRRMPYDSIGTPSGNPPGTLPASQAISLNGLQATMTLKIQYVSDPAPTSYTTNANYKRVTLTITRTKDSRQMAKEITYVAPPGRAPYGGINQAIVNAQVVDYALNAPVQDVPVALQTGPSAPRSDFSDAGGNTNFPSLTPNPDTSSFYDLVVTPPNGYQALSDDVSPNAPAHASLAPGQTFNTVLRIFKPATINLAVNNAVGTPYIGTASVKVSSSRQTQTFTVTTGTLAVTSLNGESIVPGLQYTVSAKTSTPLCGDPAPQYVPDSYPTVLTSTITAKLIACPSGTLVVTVSRSNGSLLGLGATVNVTGGPNAVLAPPFTTVTTLASQATFVLPTGTGYTVKAYNCALADSLKSAQNTAVTIVSGVNNLTLTNSTSTCPLP